ncbi:kinase/pyrophosphorylase [Solemya pervernicosa gill symbiont]|uniref:kinase/pyrophosphorylase n=1 Tax=Solemya pervernicosa gill symbiont TaxID=642797 RepID=UPI0022A9ACC2|nr:kinase/pyrophosphorylase [Solemya pervernicosa gill symbiont]
MPKALKPYRDKLFGLTIEPERLQQVRTERRPNSRYATDAQCRMEVKTAEALYKQMKIPYLNTSTVSIEEISTTILQQAGLKRRLYG